MRPLHLAMALAFTTSAHDQIGRLGSGVFTGHISVLHSRCVLEGAGSGPDGTIVRADGTFGTMVRATADRQSFTLRNLTLDLRNRSDVGNAIEVNSHIPRFVAENVRIINYARGNAAVDNRGDFRAYGLWCAGSGAPIVHRTPEMGFTTKTTIREATVDGGQYAFQNSAGGLVDLEGVHYRGDYWQTPTYEAVTATGYDALGVNVQSHVEEDRSSGDLLRYLRPVTTFTVGQPLSSRLVQLHDRVEVDGEAWTSVDGRAPDGSWLLGPWRSWGTWNPCDAPTGTATVYRITLGRAVGYEVGENRLLFQIMSGGTLQPPAPRWRTVTGQTAATPTVVAGSRLDIIRHGDPANNGTRDTDSGAFNIGNASVGARIIRCSAFGGASDMFTFAGEDTVAVGCLADLGYDECYTIHGTNGPVTLRDCQANRAGRTGFHLRFGPSYLYRCTANDNGTINDGSGDYGCSATGITGYVLQVRGRGNLDNLAPAGTIVAPWEPRVRVVATRSSRRLRR